MPSRFLFVLVGSAGALAFAVGSCSFSSSESDESAAQNACNTPGCNPADDAAPAVVLGDVNAPDATEIEDEPGLVALCGDGCRTEADGTPLLPGDHGACEGVESPSEGGAGGAPELGCSVTRGDDGLARSECVPSGTAQSGLCGSVSDCAPGYACVGEDFAAQCQPYCCSDPESCDEGSFCSPQPLHRPEDVDEEPLLVPVCITAHACRLDEPYPCPEGKTCTCPDGLACTVVRADGTTGCVTPGEGMEGEPCPCASASETSLGYVCSQAAQTCVKVCALGTSTSSCGAGSRCQASASLPDGFGVCTTGSAPDAG